MDEIRKAFKNPRNVIILGVILIALLFGILFMLGVFSPSAESIRKDQIQLKRGDKIVTVNENGLVEYRSDKGVFYETWDPNKTSAFFSSIRAQAREYLANPSKSKPPNAYEVTVWIDGELVTFYIDGDDEIITEVFDEFDDEGGGGGGGDLSDYFDTDLDPSVTPTSIVSLTGSPTPTLAPGVSATPTPIPGTGGQGGTGEQSAVDCDLYNTQVTKRTVISNTICQTGE